MERLPGELANWEQEHDCQALLAVAAEAALRAEDAVQETLRQDHPGVQDQDPTMQGKKKCQGQEEATPHAVLNCSLH